MLKNMPKKISDQRGEGIVGIVSMIILFVLCVKLGLSIVPPQLDDRQLTSIMGNELRKANKENQTPKKMFQAAQKQLSINGFYDTNLEEMFIVTNKTPGGIKLEKKYSIEKDLFPGVYITNKFEGEVEEVLPE